MVKIFKTVDAAVQALTPSYPVYCFRPHVFHNLATSFLQEFPGRVLYAVKCNPHLEVLKALYNAGIRHFDTASLPEIALIRENFPDAAIYFMHPVKGRAVIKTAYHVYNVDNFVVDYQNELDKIIEETGGGSGLTIFVRLKTPPVEGTFYHLADKFGASVAEAVQMLQQAQSMGCQLGLAFHVGSQCLHPEAYLQALKIVAETLKQAKVNLHFLDVGGGFPSQYMGQKIAGLAEYVKSIETGLQAISLRRDCVLMCEPGRALVAEGMSMVVQVLLRKGNQLYINDGIYGSLSETVTAKLKLPTRLIRFKKPVSTDIISYTINGCSCDSLDVLSTTFDLPADVVEGDWIEIDRIGAYSNALASHFNGFYPEAAVIVEDEPFSSLHPRFLKSND